MLILASQSSSRASILNKAGISFHVCASSVDESIIKEACWQHHQTAHETSHLLALAKARDVAEKFPNDFVLGADQMVECEGKWFDKAQSMAEAREQLQFLRGKSHTLSTSAVIIHQNKVVWRHITTPILTMRLFSNEFIDDYLIKMDNQALNAVGCYQVEKLGIQLFSDIQGDIFSIMGLPLLPLLEFLRDVGIVEQ